MNALYQLTLNQFRQMLRNPFNLFFSIALPVVLLILFGSIFGNTGEGFDMLLPGHIAWMLLAANISGVAITLAFDRERGSLRHLFTTPVSPALWLLARTISILVLSVVQLALLFAVSGFVFGVLPEGNWPGGIVVLLLSSLALLGVGLASGLAFQRSEAVQIFTMILINIIAFSGNIWFPINNAPDAVQLIAKILPGLALTDSLKFVLMQGQSLREVAPELLRLAATGVICFGYATWALRRRAVRRV